VSGKEYQSVLIPKYLHDFSCQGSQCEDCCCCFGWIVSIDQKTSDKYLKVTDPELKPLLEEYIVKDDQCQTNSHYKILKTLEGGRCPFLNENKLCNIQCKLGEDYLSEICSVFPRHANLIDGVLEGSGTLGCPEMARLILLNPQTIEFDHIDEWPHIHYLILSSIDTKSSPVTKYFWPLRIFTIKVLQDRSYTLWERLMFLSIFYNRTHQVSNNYKEIENFIDEYDRLLSDCNTVKNILSGIPAANHIQVKLIKSIIDLRYLHKGQIYGSRYLECYNEFLMGLNFSDGRNWDDILCDFDKTLQDIVKPWLEKNEYIFENYLVNYVFKELVPLRNDSTFFESFCMMILHYAYVSLLLVGIAAYHKGITDEIIIKLFQSFSRTVEHTPSYINDIYTLFKREDFFQLPYIAAIIKN
jgi:lysine-N-methylase